MLHENNIKKEELKARALALKILGKIFQVKYFPKGKRDFVDSNEWKTYGGA